MSSSFNFLEWTTQIFQGLIVFSLPVYYGVKAYFKDKREARKLASDEAALDRAERQKESSANIEKIFSLLYEKENRRVLDSLNEFKKDITRQIKEQQEEYKKDFKELFKTFK